MEVNLVSCEYGDRRVIVLTPGDAKRGARSTCGTLNVAEQNVWHAQRGGAKRVARSKRSVGVRELGK